MEFRTLLLLENDRVMYTLYLFTITAPRFRRNFHSYGDATITGEGLQILTCAPHS